MVQQSSLCDVTVRENARVSCFIPAIRGASHGVRTPHRSALYALALLAFLNSIAITVEARPPKTEKQNEEDQENAAHMPVERPYSVAVRPLLPNGRTQSLAYLTLWRALETGEKTPANMLDPNGLGFYAPVIWDDAEHQTRWIRERSAHPNDGRHGWQEDRFQFTELRRGKYRVTAISYRRRNEIPDPTPYGVSAPFTLEGDSSRQPSQSIEILMSGNRPLLVRTIDAESREPIDGLAIRLRDASGMPIVLGSGSGNFFERTSDRGEVMYGLLQPGDYTIEVLGKYAEPNHFEQYEPMVERALTQVTMDKDNVFEIAVAPRHLGAAEIERRFPFSVHGRVTDESGAPLDSVIVRAATGIGTLLGGSSVRTGADGSYRLYFTGGGMTVVSEDAPLGVGTQAALILASKDGCFETNLNRQGNLLMSDAQPEEFEKLNNAEGQTGDRTSIDRVVFPNRPREVNFKLAKSAVVEGTLVDNNGNEIIDQEICLVGDELPPGHSVLCSGKSDNNGRFRLANVPTHRSWRFRLWVGSTGKKVSSESFILQRAEAHRFEVTLDSKSSDANSVTFRLSYRAGVEE